MTMKNHHYFILETNPWPLVISIMSFNLLFSLLLFFKFMDFNLFLMNIINVILSSFFWWLTYGGEFNLEGKNSFMLENGLKFSMILFISSEIFFFFSFFWSYFHFFLSPMMEIGSNWPPVNVFMFDFSNVPLINTLCLISSGLTVTVSHYYLISNSLKMSHFWLWTTIILGMIFSFLQWDEYCNSFFTISDGNFGTVFFMLTGFHGIHVLIGTLFLLMVILRSTYMSSASMNFLSFELASWYWHFVDVVWIFLYFFLYFLVY